MPIGAGNGHNGFMAESLRHPKILAPGAGTQLNVQGISFTYKATSADTDGKYALTEGVVPPHHGAPAHIHHREDEAFYILEGEFEIECGGENLRNSSNI
jgi:mannose-6-phosphate isomerase-like protein (cupin superfamily)